MFDSFLFPEKCTDYAEDDYVLDRLQHAGDEMGLALIGHDSMRATYALNDDYIIKVAYAENGKRHNQIERSGSDLFPSDIIAKVIYIDANDLYLVQERWRSLDPAIDMPRQKALSSVRTKITNFIYSQKTTEYSKLNALSHFRDLHHYNIGVKNDGTIVVSDIGGVDIDGSANPVPNKSEQPSRLSIDLKEKIRSMSYENKIILVNEISEMACFYLSCHGAIDDRYCDALITLKKIGNPDDIFGTRSIVGNTVRSVYSENMKRYVDGDIRSLVAHQLLYRMTDYHLVPAVGEILFLLGDSGSKWLHLKIDEINDASSQAHL